MQVCKYFLDSAIDIATPDGSGRIPLVSAAIHVKFHLLETFLIHTQSAPEFAWKTTFNTRVVSFSEAYFEKGSPFRYLVWHMLVACPPTPMSDNLANDKIARIRKNLENCLLLLTSNSVNEYSESIPNKVVFPIEAPHDVCFTCLDLAALKQLPTICTTWVRFLVSRRSGAEASSLMDESKTPPRRPEDKAFLYCLLAHLIPTSTWQLLISCMPHIPMVIASETIWPSISDLNKVARIHYEYAHCYYDVQISESSILKSLQDSICRLTKTSSPIFKEYIEPPFLVPKDLNIIYLALETRDSTKITTILKSSTSAEYPPLLLQYATYYDIVSPVLQACNRDGMPVSSTINIDSKFSFTFYHREMSALMVAVEEDRLDAARALLCSGACATWADFILAARKSSPIISILLLETISASLSTDDLKSALNHPNKEIYDQPVLSILCARGDESSMMLVLVQQMLKSGSAINQLDCFGLSSLHYAVAQGKHKLVEVLLNWNALSCGSTSILSMNSTVDVSCSDRTLSVVNRGTRKLGRLVRCFLLKRFSKSKDSISVKIM